MEELLESMFLSTPLIWALNDQILKFFSESSVIKKEGFFPLLECLGIEEQEEVDNMIGQ